MASGFFVKVDKYDPNSWKSITNFFVKTSTTAWKSVTDAWVKVSSTTWKKFYTSATNPDYSIQILNSLNSSEALQLQGKNYHWTPSPSTLQYKFSVVNKSTLESKDITSYTTTTNPSSGSSSVLPSGSTYITITPGGSDYYPAVVNVFQFMVKATTSSGQIITAKAEYEMGIPSKIIGVTATANSTDPYGSIDIDWTADPYANIYLIQYRIRNSGSSYTQTTSTVNYKTITNLIANTEYEFRVVGRTGSTSTSGYIGTYSDSIFAATDTLPSFDIVEVTKALPGSLTMYGRMRDIYIDWQTMYVEENGGLVAASSYQYKIEASTDGVTWVDASTGSAFVPVTYPSFTTTNTYATQSVWAYYPYYRASVRAVLQNGALQEAANAPFNAVGSAPSGLSISENEKLSTSYKFNWSLTSSGSNYISDIEYKINSGGSWTSGGTSTPISITGLSANTAYTIYVRAKNLDLLYSSEQSLTFTTPVAPSGGSASISGTATQGNTLTLTKTNASGTPTPTVSWKWQRNDGGTSGSTYRDIQTNGDTYALGAYDAGYSIRVNVTWTNGVSPDQTVTTNAIGPITAIYWTVSYNANGGSGAPSSTSIIQGKSGNVTSSSPTRSGYTFNGWNTASDGSGTNYASGAVITPSADITLYAKWVVAFTTPTCPAPSWTSSGNFQRITSSSVLRWFTDYPTPSGSVQTVVGMDFEIRTTAGGGTLLASGTRAFPGWGSYPYSGGGTVWAFKMGTETGDIVYSSSARYGRVRVKMTGTDGNTYYGTWTGWI